MSYHSALVSRQLVVPTSVELDINAAEFPSPVVTMDSVQPVGSVAAAVVAEERLPEPGVDISDRMQNPTRGSAEQADIGKLSCQYSSR